MRIARLALGSAVCKAAPAALPGPLYFWDNRSRQIFYSAFFGNEWVDSQLTYELS
jgi:hypothetical protein